MAEKKKWIAGATSNSHGQFKAKAEAAGETTREYAKQEENAPGKLGEQARLAETLMDIPHKKKVIKKDEAEKAVKTMAEKKEKKHRTASEVREKLYGKEGK